MYYNVPLKEKLKQAFFCQKNYPFRPFLSCSMAIAQDRRLYGFCTLPIQHEGPYTGFVESRSSTALPLPTGPSAGLRHCVGLLAPDRNVEHFQQRSTRPTAIAIMLTACLF